MLEPTDGGVSTLNPVEDPRWDEDIAKFPGATFFHSSAWASVLSDTYGFSPEYFVDRKPALLRSILPMMEARSWLAGRRGIALPFTDECTPLCSDATTFHRLAQSLSAHTIRRKWKHWELRGGRSFLPDAPASLSFWGHTLTLDPDHATLFSHLESSTRRAIRKAEQSGLSIKISASPEAVRTFYHLLGLTRRRHGLPPQPFTFFENIWRHVLARDHGVVLLARLNQIPVAGAVFFHLGNTAIYKFGASDDSFQHLRANNLVMWRAIEWYSARNYVSLDFGRTSRSNKGLRSFKCGWGATERLIEYFKYDRSSARFVSSRDSSSGWYNHLFRLMPYPLSRLIGAAAYKHMA